MFTLPSEVTFAAPAGYGADTVTVRTDTIPPAMWTLLAIHGLKQKHNDKASGMAKGGKSAAEIQKVCSEVIANLQAGTWAEKATGPRATNLEDFINQEAKKKALSRVIDAEAGKDVPVARIIEKAGREATIVGITKKYAEHEDFRSATQKLWEARTAKAEVDLSELDI